MAQQILPTNTFTTAKWIVSATASDGTHTTIQAAINAASAGDTIFIRSKSTSYAEDLTLKAGVNLTGFTCDGSLSSVSNVIIKGNATFTGAGTVTISGVQLKTNGGAFLTVSGSAASIVNLTDCYLAIADGTGISFSSSSASARVNVFKCNGDISGLNISIIAHSSNGNASFEYSLFTNTGTSTTANTCSSGVLVYNYASISNPTTISSTGGLNIFFSNIDTSGINTTAITAGGSGTQFCHWSFVSSGSASAITTAQTITVMHTILNSSNTNVITGAGTLKYNYLTMSGSSSVINTTTLDAQHGAIGNQTATAPTAGFIGEQITSFIARASAITLGNNTSTQVTNIVLTPGCWDITFLAANTGVTTGTNLYGMVATSSGATINTTDFGNAAVAGIPSNANADSMLTLPPFRVNISTNTTYYLNMESTSSVGTSKGYGKIIGTRVA